MLKEILSADITLSFLNYVFYCKSSHYLVLMLQLFGLDLKILKCEVTQRDSAASSAMAGAKSGGSSVAVGLHGGGAWAGRGSV